MAMARFTIEKKIWKHEPRKDQVDYRGKVRFVVLDDGENHDHFETEQEAKKEIVEVLSKEASDLGNELNGLDSRKRSIEMDLDDIAEELAKHRS